MADGGVDILTGSSSEAVFEFYCQFCNDKGLHNEALGYCIDCDEYLCGKCITCHEGNRFTCHHAILDRENMPKEKPPSSNRVRKDITTMCKHHKGELIKYYCQSHEELVCGECVVEGHKTCVDIENICKVSHSVFDDTDFKDFMNKLKLLRSKVQYITTQSRDHLTKSELCYTTFVEAIDQFKGEIISILDKFKNNLRKRADELKTKDNAKMEMVENACSKLQESIDKLSTEFERLQNENRVCQAYIRMKETSEDVQDIEYQIIEAEFNNYINLYTLQPNNKLIEFLNEPDAFGLLSMENSIVSVSAKFTHHIDVRSESDGSNCLTTGTVVLPNNRLVAIEYFNSKLKLVDTKLMTLKCESQVNGRPWDADVIKRNHIVVTVPERNTILVLRVKDYIIKEGEIRVQGECRGIAYSKNKLIVSYCDPAKLEIMDLQGNVSKTVDTDKDGAKLLTNPEYVCISNDGGSVFVSDFERNAGRVISLSRNGKVKAIYTDSELKGPKKVCKDKRGNVFVCGEDTNNLHMISADCNKIKVLLTEADGLTSVVHSVSYCKQTDRLFVGMWDGVIKVYQLS